MKKIFLLSLMASMVVMFGCNDNGTDPDTTGGGQQEEFLASTSPENKNAVLEDFTGVRCGFCPQGHQIAQALIDKYGDDVVVIGVNAGIYADPAAGWANFTTSYGQALVNQSGVKGYPAGTVNRRTFIGKAQNGADGLAMSRGSWTSACESVMTEASPVNLGAKATLNTATMELVVKVDAYYTEDESGNENRINVALMQSGMIAKQSGGGEAYVHKHVMRDLLTGPWGFEVPEANRAKGSKHTETVSYDVPENYNGATIPPGGGEVIPEDLELAVYITRGKTDIITGINVPITIE